MTLLLGGQPAAPGRARGVVVRWAPGLHPPVAGAVIWCHALTPDLVEVLEDAAAVIAQRGGALSAGATLCREFGVPAVVATDEAERALCVGDQVEVDGSEGSLRIEKPSVARS